MRDRGMALLAGLVLMAAVSLLAVTAAGGMTLQQHQAANFSERLQAAGEANRAQAWGLAWLFSRAHGERETACATACFLPPGIHGDDAVPDRPEFESGAWWHGHGVNAGASPAAAAEPVFAAPGDSRSLWLIEEIHWQATPGHAPGVEGVGYYRVFARGTAAGAVAVNEAIVARPWGPAVPALPFPPSERLATFCDAVDAALPCGLRAWRRRR